MKFTCAFCKSKVPVNPMFDKSTCPGCGELINNGLDSVFRDELENAKYWMKRPKSVMARAASYANRIYDFSTHGTPMQLDEVEKRVQKRFSKSQAGTPHSLWASGRAMLDMEDKGIGQMLIRVRGVYGGYKWSYIYVVFRGSRGDITPFMSGWDESGMNIDWRANFENETQRVPWGPPDAEAHQGFMAIYGSIRTHLKAALGEAMREENKAGYNPVVIVTGHSLGAGLAQICAHDLHFSKLCKPACFPFCPPRAGNLGFVRSFNAEICDRQMFYPSEAKHFTAAISSIQWMDPVSRVQARGSVAPITAQDGKKIDEPSLVVRGLYAAGFKHEDISELLKAEEKLLYGKTATPRVRKWRRIQKQACFYHIKNIWRIQLTGFHSPQSAEDNAYSKFH